MPIVCWLMSISALIFFGWGGGLLLARVFVLLIALFCVVGGVFDSFLESLILAQDERWRRA